MPHSNRRRNLPGRFSRPFVLGLVCALLVTGLSHGRQDESNDEFSAEDLEFFESQIRPILVNRCYECHGPESDWEGSLSLASLADVLHGGDTGPALKPGNPDESLIIQSIRYEGEYDMPPESRLPAAEVDLLTEWVKRGAPWTPQADEGLASRMEHFDVQKRKAEHWCWQPIAHLLPPEVGQSDWPIDELDRFILAELEAKGLTPNPPASRRTWIRRVYIDLIGLPPTPEQVQRFVDDKDPNAFAKVVDQLLDSPQFGERWARHWADLVRYAETCGHEFDYPIPHAWRYRDYLIRAFNADVPYDQMIREHVAGDLMASPRVHPTDGFNESIVGTGFWFLGEATHAPVDVKGDEAGRIDNQIDVFSKTFLGVTVACARCHDHKFDAISTEDYYALSGYLQSSRRQEGMLDVQGKIRSTLSEMDKLRTEGAERVMSAIAEKDYAWDTTRQHLLAALELPTDSAADGLNMDRVQRLRELLNSEEVKRLDHPAHAFSLILQAPAAEREAFGDRLAAAYEAAQQAYDRSIADSELFKNFANGDLSDWYITGHAFEKEQPPGWYSSPTDPLANHSGAGAVHSGSRTGKLQGALRSPTFELRHRHIDYLIAAQGAQVRLIIDGYTMDIYNGLLFSNASRSFDTKGQYQWVRQAGDIGRYVGHRAHLEILDQGDGFASIKQIRFTDGGPPAAHPGEVLPTLAESAKAMTATDIVDRWLDEARKTVRGEETASVAGSAIVEWMLKQDLLPAVATEAEETVAINERLAKLGSEVPSPVRVQAMTDGSGENEFVFVRGNHRVLGEEAERRFLSALLNEPAEPVNEGSGRLKLADQIADPENPLTSRVIANRIWHHLMGRGIVPTVDNFGVLGLPPSHPELLDFLARRFTAEGWSVKKAIRHIVLSQTYRMSSHPTAENEAKDPTNQLWHRMPIRRMQGEVIRDSMLALTGQLDLTMYGPPVPVHLTPHMQGRGRPGRSGPVDGNRRRSIYQEVRRNFLSPFMLAFDTPIPFSAMGKRNVSNVPAQALILLNDPFVHQQAERWARRVLEAEAESPQQRIDSMYQQAFARPATEREIELAMEFLVEQQQGYDPGSDASLDDVRIWIDLAHVIFNVKEFVFVN